MGLGEGEGPEGGLRGGMIGELAGGGSLLERESCGMVAQKHSCPLLW